MLRALIVEDNPTATTIIQKKIMQANGLLSEQIIVQDTLLNFLDRKKHKNFVEASIQMIQQYQPNIVFLDIQLDNDNDGFAVLGEFQNATFSTIIITSFLHLAIAAARRSVAGIFLKSSDAEQLAPIMEVAIQEQKKISDENSIVIVEIDRLPQKVNLNNLAFIQAYDNYSHYFELEMVGKLYNVEGVVEYVRRFSPYRLQEFLKLLPKTTFIQVHKSYIVNIKKIVAIKKRKTQNEKDFELILEGDKAIPLARDRKEEVFALIQQYKPELLRKKRFFF